MHSSFKQFLLELARRGGTIEHEQFFTKPEVASDVSNIIKEQPWFKELSAFIEPSAGGGALLKHFPGAKGYDLVPQGEGIEQADFLSHEFKTDPSKTLIFGNPPFGRGGSLALKFIRKAAELADTIAFILPATFAKTGMKNRLPSNFHLEFEKKLPKDSFVSPSGAELDVICVFQIWRRGSTEREKPVFKAEESPVQFVKQSEADFAVRKIGDNKSLGRIEAPEDVKTPSSYFFLKGDKDLQASIRKCSWEHIHGTAAQGLKSISRLEFVTELSKHL